MRKLKGHQTEVFTIWNGYENIDRNIVVKHKIFGRTRGHQIYDDRGVESILCRKLFIHSVQITLSLFCSFYQMPLML